MDRSVETALGSAGDFAGASVWRQACRELATGLRVAILGTDGDAAARLARSLAERWSRIAFEVVLVDAEADDDATLGAEDTLLGVHAALWATPVTAALGASERRLLEALGGSAPVERGVVLTDAHLLERISDDPEAEARQVRSRLQAITPEGWPLRPVDDLGAWLRDLLDRSTALTRARRDAVARVLLSDARERTARALRESEQALARAEQLLDEEDAALDEARRHGERIAAHLLGVMRRHTERLLLDLREFLAGLEGDLPEQAATVDDLATLRRVLPHWLDHVVESWIDRRLADWRAGVLADIEAIRLDDEEARRAELIPPALHPAPFRAEAGWGRRLAITAALGGGAALAMFGLWAPGALLASAGLALSAVASGDQATTREHLVDSARAALRDMAREAERLLQEQLAQIEEELSGLGDRRARALEDDRAGLRTEILEQRAWHRARCAELRDTLDALDLRAGTSPEARP